eukprot:maker-scaffold_5-snap-gene-1.60-mRNA-1 protein AED:0.93 eAED:0.93 QI:0/0/0/0.5/0/0/2/0/60
MTSRKETTSQVLNYISYYFKKSNINKKYSLCSFQILNYSIQLKISRIEGIQYDITINREI